VSIRPDPARPAPSREIMATRADVLVPMAEPVPSAAVSASPVGCRPTSAAPGAGGKVHGYQLGRKLDEGGMGGVYRARRESDGELVALKTIAPAIAGTTGAVARFLREASVLRRLEHPNIVRFEQVGQSEGHLFFVMEYVPGIDLDALLQRQGRPLS